MANERITMYGSGLFPDGSTVEVAGDIRAEDCRIYLPDGYRDNTERRGWVSPTQAERRAVEIQQLADRLRGSEVLANQSQLVDALIGQFYSGGDGAALGFEWDQVENLHPDPDAHGWDAEDCRQWLDEHGHDEPEGSNPWNLERFEIAETLEGLGFAVYEDETDETLRQCLLGCVDSGDWGDVQDWRDMVDMYRDEHPAEIFEWWLVSEWFAEKLEAAGEPVLRNDYGEWWGRTCTGQAMIQDGTLQRVAAQLLEDLYGPAK